MIKKHLKSIYSLAFLTFLSLLVSGQNKTIAELENELKELDSKKEIILNKLENEKLKQLRTDLKSYGLPKLAKEEELIEHSAMSLVYSEEHEQAKWVAHIITKDIINGKQGRSNDFRPDSLVKTGSAVEKDYFLKYLEEDSTYTYDGFGYDRGHLAPSADFRWSKKALSESYFYSNMSPQLPDFNREKWADLEALLRGYIYNHPETQLYVTTGPILKVGLNKIERGVNKVSIPEEFFKVIIDLKNKKGIGFLMPNKNLHYPISSYAKTIDEIEELTGLDFFHKVENNLENELESKFDLNAWVPEKNASDVSPISPVKLPRDHFNTVQAKIYMDGKDEISVCGKIVSTKVTRNGHIFMNVDKSYPNQLFTVVVWKKNIPNFSYDIIDKWENQQVCVKGKVVEFGGTPTMIIDKEEFIEEYED